MQATKWLITGIFLLGLNKSFARKENTPKYDPRNYKNRAEIAKKELDRINRVRTLDRLQKAKINILNGSLEDAIAELNLVDDRSSQIKYIKYRYEALIQFILGRYDISLKILKRKSFQNYRNYPDICTLKLLNMLALNKADEILSESAECKKVTLGFSKNNQLWLDAMLDIKYRNSDDSKSFIDSTSFLNQENEIITIWLKVATYLNQETVIEKYIDLLTLEALKSNKIRELIGLIYYRLGKTKKALSYIEDLDTPNAENIKGNILLAQKKYELAYGHFKLALKRKKNSFNALERALPLAWQLGLWDQGVEHLYDYIDERTNQSKLLTLHAAFNIRRKQYSRASKQLRQLNKLLQYQTPLNIDVLNSYNAVMEEKPEEFEYYLTRACIRHDAMNCWLLMQTMVWNNLPKTLKRKDSLIDENSLSFNELKESYTDGAIDEEELVDQKDIEELDESLISVRVLDKSEKSDP